MTTATVEEKGDGRSRVLRASAVGCIVLAATALRVWDLGAASFWYDEVVTMRLAEAPSVVDLIRLLFQIDATRAPLHPMILQDWIATFGNSEASARSLSVVLGVATVALMFVLGRLAFDESTGRWAAFLGAFSPLLVYYSREVRMYALLTLLASLCWTLLFGMRRSRSRGKAIAYAACLVAMLFTHPLGLLMFGTLVLASALDVRGFFGSRRAWLGAHLGALAVASPWLRFYFDHAPEFLSGRLPIKFLLATPIGYVGGGSTVYVVVLALIAFGLYRRLGARRAGGEWVVPACLFLWLAVPPTILYVYSTVASPIFGPARYTLFCAPAYLVLIAQGLSRIPSLSRWTLGLGLAIAAAVSLRTMVYDPQLKADWRSFAEALVVMEHRAPRREVTVMTASDAEPNLEWITARYYLDRVCATVPFDEDELRVLRDRPNQVVYLLVGGRPGEEVSQRLRERLAPFLTGEEPSRIGASRVYRLEGRPTRPPLAPAPAAPGRQGPD